MLVTPPIIPLSMLSNQGLFFISNDIDLDGDWCSYGYGTVSSFYVQTTIVQLDLI